MTSSSGCCSSHASLHRRSSVVDYLVFSNNMWVIKNMKLNEDEIKEIEMSNVLKDWKKLNLDAARWNLYVRDGNLSFRKLKTISKIEDIKMSDREYLPTKLFIDNFEICCFLEGIEPKEESLGGGKLSSTFFKDFCDQLGIKWKTWSHAKMLQQIITLITEAPLHLLHQTRCVWHVVCMNCGSSRKMFFHIILMLFI